MPRVATPTIKQAELRTAAQTAAMVASRVQRRTKSSSLCRSEAFIAKLLVDVKKRIADDLWEDATAEHLVGVYLWAHEEVYGVPAVEEVRRTFVQAKSCAQRCIDGNFAGEFMPALDFLRWVWAREVDREKWRRDNPETQRGGRLGYRLVFTNLSMLTDYRLDHARRNGVR